jgi:hypothetical protein
MTEKELENKILGYLVNRGIFCFKVETQGTFDSRFGAYRKGSVYHIRGVSDICGILNDGRFLAIEVKTPTGRVSPEQTFFINKINKKGGLAFIARNIEDVEKNLLHYLTG